MSTNDRKVLVVILSLLLVTVLTACGAKLEQDASYYIGKNVDDVIADFNHLGLSDVETEAIEDLTSEGPLEDGTVERVYIDGKDSFKKGDSFSKDAKVKITYHSIKKLAPPVDSDALKQIEYSQIRDSFIEQGFINVATDEIYDLDPDRTEVDFTSEVSINDSSSFKTTDEFPFDANVLITCHYPYSKYNTLIKIDFTENLLFNKSDINFYVDNELEGKHKHGKDWESKLELKEGKHILTFEDVEDSTVKGEPELEVTSDLEASYKIVRDWEDVKIAEKYIDREVELASDQIKIRVSESSFVGKDYKEVINYLSSKGFTNIQKKPSYDAWSESQRGNTTSVKINGSSDYRRGDIYKKDDKIVIKYTMMEDDDPAVIKEKEEAAAKAKAEKAREEKENKLARSLSGQSCIKVRKRMKKKGYTVTYTFETTYADFTELINTGSKKDIKDYIVTKVDDIDSKKKTAELLINSKTNIKAEKKRRSTRQSLEEFFPLYEAQEAMEWYGKQQFPYGFKMHTWIGKIAETPRNKSTWFLKYYVDIKNMYGVKLEYVECEATITKKKNGDIIVKHFYIYQ